MRTESDVNDEMKVMKPEFMKRERKREQRVRARDETDLSGAILNPPPAIKISLLTTRASISLSFSPLWNALKLEREGRERETAPALLFRRGRFRRESLSLWTLLFKFLFPSNLSLENNTQSESISLSRERERKCLACVKWEIRNPRQSALTRTRKQSESDRIVPFVRAKTFLKYKFLFTRV